MKTGLSSHTEPCPPLSARLQIDLDVNLLERKTGGMGAGGGLSASAAADGGLPSCFVGSFSYSEKNLFGLNQKLSARVEMGQVCVDPWAPWVDCLCRSEGVDPSVHTTRGEGVWEGAARQPGYPGLSAQSPNTSSGTEQYALGASMPVVSD